MRTKFDYCPPFATQYTVREAELNSRDNEIEFQSKRFYYYYFFYLIWRRTKLFFLPKPNVASFRFQGFANKMGAKKKYPPNGARIHQIGCPHLCPLRSILFCGVKPKHKNKITTAKPFGDVFTFTSFVLRTASDVPSNIDNGIDTDKLPIWAEHIARIDNANDRVRREKQRPREEKGPRSRTETEKSPKRNEKPQKTQFQEDRTVTRKVILPINSSETVNYRFYNDLLLEIYSSSSSSSGIHFFLRVFATIAIFLHSFSVINYRYSLQFSLASFSIIPNHLLGLTALIVSSSFLRITWSSRCIRWPLIKPLAKVSILRNWNICFHEISLRHSPMTTNNLTYPRAQDCWCI